MRILLVTPYFPPQNAVASLRTHAFAREWSRAGQEVTVLTTAKREDQRGLELPVDGIEVVEVNFTVPRLLERLRRVHKPHSNGVIEPARATNASPGFFSRLKERTGVFSSVRMPDLTDYWVKPAIEWAKNRAQESSWDVVVSSSGPYTAHLVGRELKKSVGAGRARGPVWVADFRDLWTDNHAHCGLVPFVFRERQLERSVLREADVIVTATDGLAERLQRKCGREVEAIYNGFDRECESESQVRSQQRDGRVRLVYTGTLYLNGQDLTPLMGGLSKLKREHPEIAERLKVCVAGKSQREWRDAAERFGVKSMIELHGMVSRPDALRMQRDADALLLLDWRDRDDGVLTAKVFEYLAASAPVLVVGPHRNSEALRLVERTGRGIYAGGDEHAVASTLVTLASDANPLRLKRDAKAIEELSRSRQSLRLLELMRRKGSFAPAGK